jgi:hypothetical protein
MFKISLSHTLSGDSHRIISSVRSERPSSRVQSGAATRKAARSLMSIGVIFTVDHQSLPAPESTGPGAAARRDEYTICTAAAAEHVFTVRTCGTSAHTTAPKIPTGAQMPAPTRTTLQVKASRSSKVRDRNQSRDLTVIEAVCPPSSGKPVGNPGSGHSGCSVKNQVT